MSTHLSHAQYVVALVGATGGLGKDIVKVFLSYYKPFFSRVIVIARDPSSADIRLLAEQGAEIRQVDTADAIRSFAQAFEGVDVVVNLQGVVPLEYKNAVFDGALKSGVKVYFPSEYGSDHRINDFPGWDDAYWLQKAQHVCRARAVAKGKVKVIALYVGLFIETALGPWFGFDTANRVYTAVGSADAKCAFTSRTDIGRSIAELSLLSLNSATAPTVPDNVRIVAENLSYRQNSDIVQRIQEELAVEPKGEIVIQVEDYEAYKNAVREDSLKRPSPDPLRHIRLLIPENKMDFTEENDNELVNPGQKVWKWRTVEEYIREVGGKPFF